ncbi:hypothetical protein [Amycolatopsis sp. NPDC049868]|uniref:hypothetical protein n=1 Tax=Amycolatopsis sp. NPDC049868 TaxID=3363934 RepID=UPI0037946A8C
MAEVIGRGTAPSPPPEPPVGGPTVDEVSHLLEGAEPESWYVLAAWFDRAAEVLREAVDSYRKHAKNLADVWHGVSAHAYAEIADTMVTRISQRPPGPTDGELSRRVGEALANGQRRLRDLHLLRAEQPGTDPRLLDEQARRILLDLEIAYAEIGMFFAEANAHAPEGLAGSPVFVPAGYGGGMGQPPVRFAVGHAGYGEPAGREVIGGLGAPAEASFIVGGMPPGAFVPDGRGGSKSLWASAAGDQGLGAPERSPDTSPGPSEHVVRSEGADDVLVGWSPPLVRTAEASAIGKSARSQTTIGRQTTGEPVVAKSTVAKSAEGKPAPKKSEVEKSAMEKPVVTSTVPVESMAEPARPAAPPVHQAAAATPAQHVPAVTATPPVQHAQVAATASTAAPAQHTPPPVAHAPASDSAFDVQGQHARPASGAQPTGTNLTAEAPAPNTPSGASASSGSGGMPASAPVTSGGAATPGAMVPMTGGQVLGKDDKGQVSSSVQLSADMDSWGVGDLPAPVLGRPLRIPDPPPEAPATEGENDG